MARETKSAWLKLRVGERELAAFRASAESEGLALSEWVRRVSLIRVAELGLLAPQRIAAQRDAA